MSSFKTIEELNLPEVINEIIDGLDDKSAGLILVNGQPCSGKSTTIASMVDRINSTRDFLICTFEESVEFKHEDNLSVISQKEIDMNHIADSVLKGLFRRPNVIVLSELRSADDMALALMAADTGHIVIASMYTDNILQTIERIVDTFPHDRVDIMRERLGNNLLATIHQCLISVGDGSTRLPIVEIFRQTDETRDAIKDPSKTHLIPQLIEESKGIGMQTMRSDYGRLLNTGKISSVESPTFSNGSL